MGMRKIPKDTKYFKYVCLNPKGRRVGDCTIRAIAGAGKISWEDAARKLFEKSLENCCAQNDYECVEDTVIDMGFLRMKQPKKEDGSKYTGKDFIDALNAARAGKGIYDGINLRKVDRILIAIGCHHVSTIVYDKECGYRVNDSWDCSGRCIGRWFAKVEKR